MKILNVLATLCFLSMAALVGADPPPANPPAPHEFTGGVIGGPNDAKPATTQPSTNPSETQAKLGLKITDVSPYAIIPLKGEFGAEIREELFQASVDEARRCGAKYIFLDIDSPGGYVRTANNIADIMKKTSKDVKYFCFVEHQALSASIWVAFSSETIFMTDGSSLGAAVAFTTDNKGIAQVSKKFNSAMAAEIAARAESNGYPTAIIRAMVQEGSEAYAWQGKDGKWIVDSTKPRLPAAQLMTLSNGRTILTLTGREAAKIGIAKMAKSMAEAIDESGLKNPLRVTVTPELLAITFAATQSALRSIPHPDMTDEEFNAANVKGLMETAKKTVGGSPKLFGNEQKLANSERAMEALVRSQIGVSRKIASLRVGLSAAGQRPLSQSPDFRNTPFDDQQIILANEKREKEAGTVYSDAGKHADDVLKGWLLEIQSNVPKYIDQTDHADPR